MQSRFIDRPEGFRTHYLEWQPKAGRGRLPVVCIHGNLSNAGMYRWIGDELSSGKNESPRHVVAIDMRGCGDSGMPEEGFSLRHMAADIEAVLKHLGIGEAHFIAYSRGTAYALQYALQNPGSVQGLVIGDYPPYYPKLSEDWAERMVQSYRVYESWDRLFEALASAEEISRERFEAGKDVYYTEKAGVIQKRYEKEFPIRLQRESDDYDLTPALDHFHGRLLIVKGEEKGSLLSEEQMKAYEPYNPEIVRVQQAGHDVFEPRDQVLGALLEYFNRME